MNDSDIVECNGQRIAELRRMAELTQDQLAAESSYSVRVIRKAESGGTIRFSTLTGIAIALQRHGATATATDLCSDPVAVVQAFVQAYRLHEEQMVEKIMHLLSPDLEVFVAGDPQQIPFAGFFHGPSGLQEFWNRFFGLIERYDKNALDLQYFANGHEVVAYGTEKARVKGHNTDEPSWLSLKFDVRDGKIERFEDYFDTASAQKYIQDFRHRKDAEEDDPRNNN